VRGILLEFFFQQQPDATQMHTRSLSSVCASERANLHHFLQPRGMLLYVQIFEEWTCVHFTPNPTLPILLAAHATNLS